MSRETSLARIGAWALDTEGSSRSSALIRIGLALLIWARYASDFLLYRHEDPGRAAFALAFFGTTTAMAAGVWSRTSTGATAVLLLVMFYYGGITLGNEPWVAHHTYLLASATLLCALTPCGRSYSLDRWWVVLRAERESRPPPSERGNLFGLRLIALQLALVYLWTAYAKTNMGFLSGARLEHFAMWYYLGSDRPDAPVFEGMAMLASWITVALEYALAVGLLFARTRRWLILPALVLHGLFYILLPVRTFTLTMWLLLLATLDADAVHRAIDRISGAGPTHAEAKA